MNLLTEELKILAVLTNSPEVLELVKGLSKEELETRVVSKAKMIEYKLRGSPKLSKIFLSFGIPQKLVSLALSAQAGGSSRISAHLMDLRDQGNSIYYSSCQATDRRSKWFTHGVGNAEYLNIHGDEPHLGKSLFMWVSGQRMSIDGKGFKARAKLRLIYSHPVDWFGNELLAVYVDRIYGDEALLKADLPLLKEWVQLTFGNVKIVSATTQWSEKRGFIFGTEVFCPSAASGYQDSTPSQIKSDTYHKLLSSERESYFLYKYQLRKKQCGVYGVRTGELELQEERVRPHLTSRTRELIKTWISILGYPDRDSRFRETFTPGSGNEFVLRGTKGGLTVGLIQQERCLYTFKGDTREALLRLGVSHTNVLSTSTELGFYPAVGYETYGKITATLNLLGLPNPTEVYRLSLDNSIYRVVCKSFTLTYNSKTSEFTNSEGELLIKGIEPTVHTYLCSHLGLEKATIVSKSSYSRGFEQAIPVNLKTSLRSLRIKDVKKYKDGYSFYSDVFWGEKYVLEEKGGDAFLIGTIDGDEIATISSKSLIVLQDNEELGLYSPVLVPVNLESVLIRLRKLLAFLRK